MPIRAAMLCEPRIHQPETVQQFCSCAESTAYAGNARTLPERKGCWDIQHLIHLRLFCLRHTPSRICGERFEVPSGTLRIQDSQRQGRFPGARHTSNSDDLIQRDIHINVLQIVYSCPAHFDMRGHFLCIMFQFSLPLFLFFFSSHFTLYLYLSYSYSTLPYHILSVIILTVSHSF